MLYQKHDPHSVYIIVLTLDHLFTQWSMPSMFSNSEGSYIQLVTR